MRVLCGSDFQIGAGRTLGRTLADHDELLGRIVDVADEQGAELFLFCGDAFERRSTTRDQDEVFMRFLVAMSRVCPILLVGGNHDWRGYERASTVGIFREMGVTVALEPGVHRFGDLAIATLPWASLGHIVASRNGGDRAAANEDAAIYLATIAGELRSQIQPGETAILAAHWHVTGASLPSGLPTDSLGEPVLEMAELEEQDWDIMAFGHLHKGQTVGERGGTFVCGSPYVCDWGEADFPHGVWMLKPAPATRSAKQDALLVPSFIPIEDHLFVTLELEPGDGDAGVLWPEMWAGDLEGAIVRVQISATQEQARGVDVPALKRAIYEAGAHYVSEIKVDVGRAERARVEGLTEELGEMEALDLYLTAHADEIAVERAEAIRERTDSYLARLDSSERSLGGGFDPIRLRAHNFRTLGDIDIPFHDGVYAISGENGSGKSSILMAIDVALFGARQLGRWLSHGEQDMRVELTFASGADHYRIRRSFSAKGRGKSATDLERRAGESLPFNGEGSDWIEEWEPASRESQSTTQADVESLIGFTRDTLHASALIMQGASDRWITAPPGKRMELLIDAVGVTAWPQILDLCRIDKRQTERSSTELAGRISFLEEQTGDIARLDEDCSRLRSVVSASESELARAGATLDAAAVAVQEIERAEAAYRERSTLVTVAEARVREYQAVVDRAAAAKLEAVDVQRQIADAGDPGERLAELEAQREEYEAQSQRRREAERERDILIADAQEAGRQVQTLGEERDRLEIELGTLRRQAADLNDPAKQQRCPTCEQELHGEAHSTALTRVLEARDDVERRVRALGARIDDLDGKARAKIAYAETLVIPDAPNSDAVDLNDSQRARWRIAETNLAALRAQLVGLQRTVDELTPEILSEVASANEALLRAQESLAEVDEPEPGAGDAARVAAVTAKAQVDIITSRITEERKLEARAEAALETAKKVAGELDGARRRYAGLHDELDVLAHCERIYGNAGLPAFIVESRIPVLEAAANGILERFGTKARRVELRTQRLDSKGERLLDTLDIVGITESAEQDYEMFSGGEQSCLDVALCIGLAKMLGSRSSFLAVDEIEGLDETRQAAFIEILLEQRERVGKLYIASHYAGLRDAALDGLVEVVNEDGRSRIVGEREPVLA